MNKVNNQFLADYVYLAEASYTDFSKEGKDFDKIKDENNGEQPESFAKLVTNNYKVVAHYKDRVENGWFDIQAGNLIDKIRENIKKAFSEESGFSATLFQSNQDDEYVLAIRGTAGFKDVSADSEPTFTRFQSQHPTPIFQAA